MNDIFWRYVGLDSEYRISWARGHYEVYINNKFYCSADTIEEAVYEVEEYLEDVGRGDKAVADVKS